MSHIPAHRWPPWRYDRVDSTIVFRSPCAALILCEWHHTSLANYILSFCEHFSPTSPVWLCSIQDIQCEVILSGSESWAWRQNTVFTTILYLITETTRNLINIGTSIKKNLSQWFKSSQRGGRSVCKCPVSDELEWRNCVAFKAQSTFYYVLTIIFIIWTMEGGHLSEGSMG